jgi:hypothetical protein
MDRRTFIGAVARGLVTVRLVVQAQPAAKIYKIGLLFVVTAESAAPLLLGLTIPRELLLRAHEVIQ